jgi:hypothetical protein
MFKFKIRLVLLAASCVWTGCSFPDLEPRIEDSESLEDVSVL